MLQVALAIGLLTSTSSLEPRLLPNGATSARIQEGTARLIDDITGKPDTELTLLPEGVYFTREGYDRLVSVTSQLQEDLSAIRLKLAGYETAAITPCPPPPEAPPLVKGWATRDLVLVGAVGVVVGLVGGVVLVGLARAQ